MSLSPAKLRRAHVVTTVGALLMGLAACEADGGPPPTRAGAPDLSVVSAPPGPVAPLTPEQSRRAVLTVEDLGPGWSAGALTETVPEDDHANEERRPTGDVACDRVLRSIHVEDDRVTLRAERTFDRDDSDVSLVVSVEVHAGDGAAVGLRQIRAMLEHCADTEVPIGTTMIARYRAIAAPIVADETLGLNMTIRPAPTGGSAPMTAKRMTVRSGPNTVTLLVTGDGGLEPAALDSLTRRAGERLINAAGG